MKGGPPPRSGSNRWPAWVRYLLYFLIIVGLVKSLSGGAGGPKVGATAADFELRNVLSTGRIRLSDYRGRPVLVEVFASWCSSCREAAPLVAQLAATHRSHVDFVGVSVDETAEQALATATRWGIKFPVAHDDGTFSRSYSIGTIPSFILIDRNGVVVRTIRGVPKRDALDAWLTELGRSR